MSTFIRSVSRSAALGLLLMVAGCLELQVGPAEPSSSSGEFEAMQEVAKNPDQSIYYTEPLLSYGYPGDGQDRSGVNIASSGEIDSVKVASKMAAAASVQAKADETMLDDENIVGTGLSVRADGEPELVIFKQRETASPRVAAKLNGVDTREIVVGEIKLLGYTGTYRPVMAGVSVGNSRENSSGTIGAVVVRNGIRYMLSNNHVLARQNRARIGEPIVQPGRADNYGRPTEQIGVLTDYVAVSTSRNNAFDAAIARYTEWNSYSMPTGTYSPSRTTKLAQNGMRVMKVGRTTGLTRGEVGATNVTLKVEFDGGVAVFTNQIYIPGQFLKAGDSGSLLVTESGQYPVGLCFAGGDDAAFANPIQPILDHFGVKIAGKI